MARTTQRMQSLLNHQCPPFIIITFLCFSLFAQGPEHNPGFSRGMYYFGPLITYSKRSGYYDFGTIQKSVPVAKANLFSLGLGGGVRVPFTRFLRAQVGLALDFGNIPDDTLQTNQPAIDKVYYYHAALEPSLHCALVPPKYRVIPFVDLGAGANVVWVNEHTFFTNDPGREVVFTDRRYVNEASWSFSAHAGLGLDIAVTSSVGLGIMSTFRYLYPVSYQIEEDFPLHAQKYSETHQGNVTWVGVLFTMK
jgi:hypothetical protein